jgi:phospholipase C
MGKLPKVSIIDPTFLGAGANDDHPAHDIKLGEALIASVFAALAGSPQWSKSLFVLTYDEHGGFFDHVPPPATTDADPEFAQLGFRVPTIVAGPFARKGCVVSTQLEHVSVLKTLATRFKLPNLNTRMAAANDLSSCLDPAFLDNPQKPPVLPRVKVSRQKLRAFRPTKITQPELWALAESGRIPAHLDRRAHSLAIAEHVLEQGARLGAIELV